jgi:hypothetical protein
MESNESSDDSIKPVDPARELAEDEYRIHGPNSGTEIIFQLSCEKTRL